MLTNNVKLYVQADIGKHEEGKKGSHKKINF